MSWNKSSGTVSKVGILGVPLGYGAGKTGSELGVEAMRLSLMRGGMLIDHIRELGYEVADYGNSTIVRPEAPEEHNRHPKYINEMVTSCANIAKDVKRVLSDGAFPVILGGDHSIAIGSLSGIASHYRDEGKDIGLIWFDAHADINTPETSTSGNIHGMPFATILGHGHEALVNVEGFSPKIKSE